MKTKFKVGDTVELISNRGISAEIGAIGTIYKIDDRYTYISWDREINLQSKSQENGAYYPESFKIIKTKITNWRDRIEWN